VKLYVRFGSKADMCSARRHVRFTPDCDRAPSVNAKRPGHAKYPSPNPYGEPTIRTWVRGD